MNQSLEEGMSGKNQINSISLTRFSLRKKKFLLPQVEEMTNSLNLSFNKDL